MKNDTVNKKDIIVAIGDILIFVLCITLFLNWMVPSKQDIIKTFEHQIIASADHDKGELLDNTSIKYTKLSEEEKTDSEDNTETSEDELKHVAYFGENHAIITTEAHLYMLDLTVRYNEEGEIILLDYSCSIILPGIIAIVLGCVVAFLLSCLWEPIFEEILKNT